MGSVLGVYLAMIFCLAMGEAGSKKFACFSILGEYCLVIVQILPCETPVTGPSCYFPRWPCKHWTKRKKMIATQN